MAVVIAGICMRASLDVYACACMHIPVWVCMNVLVIAANAPIKTTIAWQMRDLTLTDPDPDHYSNLDPSTTTLPNLDDHTTLVYGQRFGAKIPVSVHDVHVFSGIHALVKFRY